MKRAILYISLSLLMGSCVVGSNKAPYSEEALSELNIKVEYPDAYKDLSLEGAAVTIENIDLGSRYKTTVDAKGESSLKLTNGRYIVQFSSRNDKLVFNATQSDLLISDKDQDITLEAVVSMAGNIIVKEIYCGGCTKKPEEEGDYGFDKYIILHNNESEVTYLDGLCFGMLDPANAEANNKFTGDEYKGKIALGEAIWKFGGDGTTFPLQPGEDAVVCQNGAIDHSAIYSSSVNLNKSEYFVIYNSAFFTHTNYHPTPGNNILPERHLNLVQKYGMSTGWGLSLGSPAIVIFMPTGGETIEEYLQNDGVINTTHRVAFIPEMWVLDGVEVFYGGSSGGEKRLSTAVDAGYVTQSAKYDGKSLHRNVDEARSAELGFEVLSDSNNSSNDFYETSHASLYESK